MMRRGGGPGRGGGRRRVEGKKSRPVSGPALFRSLVKKKPGDAGDQGTKGPENGRKGKQSSNRPGTPNKKPKVRETVGPSLDGRGGRPDAGRGNELKKTGPGEKKKTAPSWTVWGHHHQRPTGFSRLGGRGKKNVGGTGQRGAGAGAVGGTGGPGERKPAGFPPGIVGGAGRTVFFFSGHWMEGKRGAYSWGGAARCAVIPVGGPAGGAGARFLGGGGTFSRTPPIRGGAGSATGAVCRGIVSKGLLGRVLLKRAMCSSSNPRS